MGSFEIKFKEIKIIDIHAWATIKVDDQFIEIDLEKEDIKNVIKMDILADIIKSDIINGNISLVEEVINHPDI